jgi:hypothetical protein
MKGLLEALKKMTGAGLADDVVTAMAGARLYSRSERSRQVDSRRARFGQVR